MSNIAIKVEGVSKDFRITHDRGATIKSRFVSVFKGKKSSKAETQHAIKNISFEIKKGEFFGIVGRNGSGKSTMLKMLAGIYQPTGGSIEVNGKLVPFIELGVGFNPELTGRENVYLNGALLGFSRQDVDAFYDQVVEFAELEEFMDKKLKNYSSGMQVRLAFAMAIRARADILLIDEVLAVGDADFQHKCFSYFRTLKRQDCTVIFVSHDMAAVREYCDRAILIEDGKIKASGKPSKIADEYTKLFLSKETNTKNNKNGESRYGNGAVAISRIKPIHDISSKKTNIIVDFMITANESVENLVIGIRCKNLADQPLLGTNTKIERAKISDLEKGECKRIKFSIPNIFNAGTYSIDISVENADGLVYDWIVGAVDFDVKTEKQTGYIVEVPIKTEITNE